MAKTLRNFLFAGTVIFSQSLNGCAGKNLEPSYIELPGGYKTIKPALNMLKNIAGIDAGTIKLGFERKNNTITKKPVIKGRYSIKKYPESMIKIARGADGIISGNPNGIIDYEEAKVYEDNFYNLIWEFYFGKK